MSTFLRTIEFLGLSVWLGSDIFLSFVVAPGAFRILGSRDQAGTIVSFSLTRMHLTGIALGAVVLLARAVRAQTISSLAEPAGLCIAAMVALTAISQIVISPRMAALRAQMGSIQATAEGSPLLAQFGRLHAVSVSLESGVLLAGILCMYLMVRELGAQ